MSASWIIYEAAGRPEMPAQKIGRCVFCGVEDRGASFAVSDKWTDWDLVSPGEIICRACSFALDERSLVLARRVGKDRPQRMRNYSHFVVGDVWYPLSKADKQRMLELLPRADVAIIAESGQKHLIIRAQPGRWQFEMLSLEPRVDWILEMTTVLGRMLGAGIHKSSLRTLTVDRISSEAARLLLSHIDLLRRWQVQRGPYYELALWLAQAERTPEQLQLFGS